MKLINLLGNAQIEFSAYLEKFVLTHRQQRDYIQPWYILEKPLRKFIPSYSNKHWKATESDNCEDVI